MLGNSADSPQITNSHFSDDLQTKFEIHSYRNAASILRNSYPEQYNDIINALSRFQISESMIRKSGGSKSSIAKYVDSLFSDGWEETRITADLQVRLLDAKKKDRVLSQYTREGYLDGHRIDFVKGKVALDLEWNSKDQTYDRDLYAFFSILRGGRDRFGCYHNARHFTR